MNTAKDYFKQLLFTKKETTVNDYSWKESLILGLTDLGGQVSSRIKIYMLYLLLCAVDSSLPRVLKNHEWSKSW